MPHFPDRLRHPPTVEDPVMERWLRELTDEVNAIPQFSTFSSSTPESTITGLQGTYGVNLSSTGSVLWGKRSKRGSTNAIYANVPLGLSWCHKD